MTRLREGDIHQITGQLTDYDARLKRMTGCSLRQIACRASGVDEALVGDAMTRVRIAAVPVTSGLGVIGGFSSTVASIVSHIGFDTLVTDSTDVAGIAEGMERGAHILMLSDDEHFVAVSPGRPHVVDNSVATARGFVAGLELMRGGLAGEVVLVMGCGPVGFAGAKALIHRGAAVALCDRNTERARSAQEELGRYAPGRVMLEEAPHGAIKRYELLFDATNMGDFIEAADLTPDTMAAAPGMPCSFTGEAMKEHGGRILHDALEIGTATMAVQAAVTFGVDAETSWGREE